MLLVSDANIFIDFEVAGLTAELFRIPRAGFASLEAGNRGLPKTDTGAERGLSEALSSPLAVMRAPIWARVRELRDMWLKYALAYTAPIYATAYKVMPGVTRRL